MLRRFFFCLLSFVVFFPAAAFAQTPAPAATPPLASAGPVTYEQIMQQGIIFAGICASRDAACACRDSGDCEITDILQVLVNVITFILGISGSVALLLFIYGGIVWLTSGGNMESVTKGKNIVVGALIGLLIIFGSYALITAVISLIRTGALPEEGATVEGVVRVEGTPSVIRTQ